MQICSLNENYIYNLESYYISGILIRLSKDHCEGSILIVGKSVDSAYVDPSNSMSARRQRHSKFKQHITLIDNVEMLCTHLYWSINFLI